MLPSVLEGARTKSSCAGTTRKSDSEYPSVARNKGTTKCDNRQVRGRATAK